MQDKIQLTTTLGYRPETVLFNDIRKYVPNHIADHILEDTNSSLNIVPKIREAGYKELADAWENDEIDIQDVARCIYVLTDETKAEYADADDIMFAVTYTLNLKELNGLVTIRRRQREHSYNAERLMQLLKGVILYTSASHDTQEQLEQLTAMGFEESDLRYFGFKDQDLAKFYEDEEDEQSHIEVDYLDFKLEELNLSVRAYNCLKRTGVQTMSDIIMLEPEGLRNVRNLGQRGYAEVVNAIREKTGAKLSNW